MHITLNPGASRGWVTTCTGPTPKRRCLDFSSVNEVDKSLPPGSPLLNGRYQGPNGAMLSVVSECFAGRMKTASVVVAVIIVITTSVRPCDVGHEVMTMIMMVISLSTTLTICYQRHLFSPSCCSGGRYRIDRGGREPDFGRRGGVHRGVDHRPRNAVAILHQ